MCSSPFWPRTIRSSAVSGPAIWSRADRRHREYPRIAWFSCSGCFRFLDSSARVFFCVGAMVFYCDARLALLSMIPVPLMLWVFYLARKELATTYGAQQIAVSRTNDTLGTAFSGVRIVKAFNGVAGQERVWPPCCMTASASN